MNDTHIDLASLRAYYERFSALRPRMLDNAKNSSLDLGKLMNRAFYDAACEQQLGLFDRLPISLQLGVETGLAMFTCAASPGRPVTFQLGGQSVTQEARIGPDQVHTGRWQQLFYGATLLNDSAFLKTLCAFPLAIPLRSPTQGENVDALWIRVLHTFATAGRFDAQLMTQALEATDPSKLPQDVIDLTLYLTVPCLDLLFRIALGDAPAFRSGLGEALEKHRCYWGTPELAKDPTGFVSWPLSAIAAIAEQQGMGPIPEHPYLVRPVHSAPILST